MAAGKGVVFAFEGRREGFDTMEFAVCMKRVASSGQDFMSIGLVSHVPHDAIVGGIKHVMQGHG